MPSHSKNKGTELNLNQFILLILSILVNFFSGLIFV
jgi:hypothetical protein